MPVLTRVYRLHLLGRVEADLGRFVSSVGLQPQIGAQVEEASAEACRILQPDVMRIVDSFRVPLSAVNAPISRKLIHSCMS